MGKHNGIYATLEGKGSSKFSKGVYTFDLI